MSMVSFASISPILKARAQGLLRHLKAGLAVACLTAAGSLLLPNHYTSQTTILPMDGSGGGMGGVAAAAAAFGMSLGTPGGGDANWVDILNSTWLKTSLLNSEFKFHTRNFIFGAERFRQESLYTYLEQKDMDRAVKKLDILLNANRDIKSNIITITMESRSPELSQQVVQRATELLQQFVLHMNRTRSGEKAAFATERLAEARKEMGKAEEDLRNFINVNRNYQSSTDPGVRLRGERLDAELRLRQGIVSTLASSKEQALLDAKNDVPILNVLDQGNLPIQKSWPARSVFVFISFLLAAGGGLAWEHRKWIKENLLDATKSESEEP